LAKGLISTGQDIGDAKWVVINFEKVLLAEYIKM